MTGAEWTLLALCSQVDPELFFAPEDSKNQHLIQTRQKQAKQLCGLCDVTRECLDEALAVRDRFGIRAGLTPAERDRLGRTSILGVAA